MRLEIFFSLFKRQNMYGTHTSTFIPCHFGINRANGKGKLN